MAKPVFIIGGSHHNTLGVIRAFGEKGLSSNIVLFISSDDKTVSKSRYISRKRLYFFEHEQQLPQMLLKAAQDFEEKPVIICCGDSFIATVDKAGELLSKYFHIPHGHGRSAINVFLDKDRQRKLASDIGLKMARSYDPDKTDLNDIDYPCIVKPENSTMGSKDDIAICKSITDLRDYINSKTDRQIIIEEYIDKASEFQLIGCSLAQKIIIPGYTDIIRQPENTNTGYLKYSPIDDGFISKNLLDKVNQFIRKIGYVGLFSVEFMRGKDGVDYFLEINMRNDGNAYCVTTAGVNLPYLWYKYADDSKTEITEQTTFTRPIYWLPEADLKSIKTIGPAKWISQWLAADSHAYASLHDPMPFVHYFYRLIERHIKKK